MNILIVDNNASSRQQTRAQVEQAGHSVLEARSAEHALSTLTNYAVDMLLIDSHLPEIRAFDLIRTVRAQFLNWFPVMLLSDLDHDAYLAEGIHSGADDYLRRPISQPLLCAKLSAMERISLMKRELDAANRQLRQLSTQDPLTGLMNRRGLENTLEKEWLRQRRENGELSVLMIDIDHFKQYNDHYGHPRGDSCLRQVADQLNRCLKRSHDVLARFGGEEFIAILPDSSEQSARMMAAQMLSAINAASIPHQSSDIAAHITLSIGISATDLATTCCDELIEQADRALYLAKNYGRNQLVSYGEITTLINKASSRPVAVG